MTSQICLAIGACVMYIHALVNAARNQAAAQPASEECNHEATEVGDGSWLRAGLRVDLGVTCWADHVGGVGPDWHNCRHNGRGHSGRLGREGAHRGHSADRLSIAGRSTGWRNETVGWRSRAILVPHVWRSIRRSRKLSFGQELSRFFGRQEKVTFLFR
uniref:Secreted protein n=1 Tax=Phlebotomus kandelakii TaxID=1109342 RepID=A0A6B2EJ39_9DIPT